MLLLFIFSTFLLYKLFSISDTFSTLRSMGE